jgi:hypothetical protein
MISKTTITKKILVLAFTLGVLLATAYCQSSVAATIKPAVKQDSIAGINPKVLQLAMNAYIKAKNAGFGDKEILTIVDYSMPSTARRLWVIDMRTQQILFNTHVAHGSGSGGNIATKFSNRHGSRMSSIGMFLTSYIYNGKYGNSLNMIGLDGEFNSNAEARRIVFHRANYVDEKVIKQIGRLGRSFGCLALNVKIADKIMHTIKNGSLVFCYYPDPKWLRESKWL